MVMLLIILVIDIECVANLKTQISMVWVRFNMFMSMSKMSATMPPLCDYD